MKIILLVITMSFFSLSCESKTTVAVDDAKKTAVDEVAQKAADLKKETELATKIDAIDKQLVDNEAELQKESDSIEETLTELDGI